MTYRFNVTAFLDKVIEIEADSVEGAFDAMRDKLMDVDMDDAEMRFDDREYHLIGE